jgi:erythromycin esterase-like protein
MSRPAELVDWLRDHNAPLTPERQVGFHGLDLYGLAAAAENVAGHLSKFDPESSELARRNYECLLPYRDDPTEYATAALRPGFDSCEEEVSAVSRMLEERPATDPVAFEALQNARSVVGGERYYRGMAAGGRSSWNLRDQHMFDTLLQVLEARGASGKAIVWAHNSHVGDASATEMGRRGEHNIGQLCRRHFGSGARLVGFGTDRGTVMAASRWGGIPQVMEVRPSLPGSYGALFREAGPDPFLLDLRAGVQESLREALKPERLERAIGVMYLPGSERVSHYFGASLPDQFDAYLWFPETRAVTPLRDHEPSLPAGHPFAT